MAAAVTAIATVLLLLISVTVELGICVCTMTVQGTGQASLVSVRELLQSKRFALRSAEVERLVQHLGVADDSDVVSYDHWAAAMISWKTVCCCANDVQACQ